MLHHPHSEPHADAIEGLVALTLRGELPEDAIVVARTKEYPIVSTVRASGDFEDAIEIDEGGIVVLDEGVHTQIDSG